MTIMLITTQDQIDNDEDLLALAEAVGVVTIPNPKPRTMLQKIDDLATTAYRKIVDLENRVAERVVHERYVGRHRATEPPSRVSRIWSAAANRTRSFGRSILALSIRIDRPLVSLWIRWTRESREAAAEMEALRTRMDRARRDISFFHHVINQPQES